MSRINVHLRNPFKRYGIRARAAWIATWVLTLLNIQAPTPAQEPRAAGPPRISSVQVGIANHYKLGAWTPVDITVAETNSASSLHVAVVASDNDGVETTTRVAVPPSESKSGSSRVVAYTQVGRLISPVRVTLMERDQPIDERTFSPNAPFNVTSPMVPLPAASDLIAALGDVKIGLSEAFPGRRDNQNDSPRAIVVVDDVETLPAKWFGYDAVNVVVLSAGDSDFCRRLQTSPDRLDALERWVEQGGRLIVFCGGANAPTSLDPSGPLARFLPGTLAEAVSLPDMEPLESFAAGAPRILSRSLPVSRLVNVQGKIEVYAGRRPTDLPLVIRTPRVFGEITFVALELSEPPLATWPGRSAFLQSLFRPYLTDGRFSESSQRLGTSGVDDLSGALRQQLGRSIPGVRQVSFPIVAGLTMAYLLILGPLDYFIIHRWLRRPIAAWVTFPLIVCGFTAVALALGSWSRGSAAIRLNRLALVDVDTVSAKSRGTLWATVFSPQAARFNLRASPSTYKASPLASPLPSTDGSPREPDLLFSWWGLSGRGIGGMQSTTRDLGIIQPGYSFGHDRASLNDLPILAAGTKSLIARWTTSPEASVTSDLTDVDELLAGSITNQAPFALKNARVFYGSWGYPLGDLAPGSQVAITDELSPRHAKTLLARDALAGTGPAPLQAETRQFVPDTASQSQILYLSMFYESAGGIGFAKVPNNTQPPIDLSRHLELGRAILVAEVTAAAAQLVDEDTGQPLEAETSTADATIYRFILPVQSSSETNNP